LGNKDQTTQTNRIIMPTAPKDSTPKDLESLDFENAYQELES